MFSKFRKNKTEEKIEQKQESKHESKQEVRKEDKAGLFKRLSTGLRRTRTGFSDGLARMILGKKTIDDALLEEIETSLLVADVGAETTQAIIENLTKQVARKTLKDPESLLAALREQLTDILRPCEAPLMIEEGSHQPYVILMAGINGAGKTTTIGKLAKRLQAEGKKVMLAAGDTFRAAAVEQLQVWGERNNIPVIAQQAGADTASVIYDALQAAKARNIDVLIADTAGRLHTQVGLMDELKKITRVMGKLDETAPHETLLVLDAGIGQNALIQAEQFKQAIGLSGLVITKLDGTAKGGIIFAIANKLALPIRFIGVGEGIDDLRPFAAEEFVAALFSQNDMAKENA